MNCFVTPLRVLAYGLAFHSLLVFADNSREFTYVDRAGQSHIFDNLSAAVSVMRADFPEVGHYFQEREPGNGYYGSDFGDGGIIYRHYEIPDFPIIGLPGYGGDRYGAGGPFQDCNALQGNCGSISAVRNRSRANYDANTECGSMTFIDQWGSLDYVNVSAPYINLGLPNSFIARYGTVTLKYETREPADNICDDDIDWVVEESENYITAWFERFYTCPAGLDPEWGLSQYGIAGSATSESEYICTKSGSGYRPYITETVRQTSSKCKLGNPCDPISGNKLQNEIDLSSGELPFSRSYNSLQQAFGFAPGWTHSYGSYIILTVGPTNANIQPRFAIRGSGEIVSLDYAPSDPATNGTNYLSSGGKQLYVRNTNDSAPNTIELVLPNGTEEYYYRDTGRLKKVISPSGHETNLTYLPGEDYFIRRPLLKTVTGPFGHKLHFEYTEVPTEPQDPSDPAYEPIRLLRVSRIWIRRPWESRDCYVCGWECAYLFVRGRQFH